MTSLQAFRESHPKQTLHEWEYITGGAGVYTIVVIPGGGGTAESMFAVNTALESRARVISVGIPASAATVEQVVAGLQGLLDALGVERAVVLGHSLGGMVA